MRQELIDSAEVRFWLKVAQGTPTECWPWKAGHCVGYGWFYVGGGRENKVEEYAHRLALFYHTHIWGVAALHTCDNPPCCNPAHLYWGNKKQNAQDALRRGRAYQGEANSNAKLTNHVVSRILELRCKGALLREIEASTGVSESLVSKICRREVWAHV